MDVMDSRDFIYMFRNIAPGLKVDPAMGFREAVRAYNSYVLYLARNGYSDYFDVAERYTVEHAIEALKGSLTFPLYIMERINRSHDKAYQPMIMIPEEITSQLKDDDTEEYPGDLIHLSECLDEYPRRLEVYLTVRDIAMNGDAEALNAYFSDDENYQLQRFLGEPCDSPVPEIKKVIIQHASDDMVALIFSNPMLIKRSRPNKKDAKALAIRNDMDTVERVLDILYSFAQEGKEGYNIEAFGIFIANLVTHGVTMYYAELVEYIANIYLDILRDGVAAKYRRRKDNPEARRYYRHKIPKRKKMVYNVLYKAVKAGDLGYVEYVVEQILPSPIDDDGYIETIKQAERFATPEMMDYLTSLC
jgi:hypothetical protein